MSSVLALVGTGVQAQAAPGPISPVIVPPVAPIPTGTPLELTLDEAVALALRYNRDIRSAYLQRVVQRFDLRVAERVFVPQGEIGVEVVQRRHQGETQGEVVISPSAYWRTPFGSTVSFVWARADPLNGGGSEYETAGVILNQPLLRGAGLAVNTAPVRIARLQEEINRLQLEATVAGTVSSVITAYRSLIEAQEQVRLAEESLERTRALLETNRALIAAGRMAEADIIQTASGVANQEVSVLRARQQVVSVQLGLLKLLALASRTNVVAIEPMRAEYVKVDLDRALSTAFASRIDLLAQRKSLEQMRQSMIMARNQRLWDVSLVASATRDDGPRFFDHFRGTDTTIGLRLNIPIGDLSSRQNWLAAESGMQIAELAFEEMKQMVESQVLEAVQSVEASWRQVDAARRARALSEQALEIGQERLRFGRASNFEVLSLQADLRAADGQQLSANIAYLNALTALDQQIGSTLATWHISLND
ncbi:TolC family protein [Brevundimonas vesicularis]|uniref:TolC family protein n=1 Tax=Brevundimonas vesicularis TaxID=41276 RepID=UPI0038D435AB